VLCVGVAVAPKGEGPFGGNASKKKNLQPWGEDRWTQRRSVINSVVQMPSAEKKTGGLKKGGSWNLGVVVLRKEEKVLKKSLLGGGGKEETQQGVRWGWRFVGGVFL